MSRYGDFSGAYFPVFSPKSGKYGPEKTPYLDNLHTADIDFTDEPVVQCDVVVVKNTLVDDSDINLIANKFWCEYLMCCFWNYTRLFL